MDNLHISIIQTALSWKNKKENLASFEQKIFALKKTDIIVLPEMFTTGFTMETDSLAEDMDGETLLWMQKMAAEKDAVVTGSYIVKENLDYFNRLVWMSPNGSYSCYDKRHLFRMAEEDEHFSSGVNNITVEIKGWKIRPLICYDLRFPVWSRNRYKRESGQIVADYDLLIYTANWPKVRVDAWDILLRARAVENQAYCVGLNRIGIDGNQKEYNGHSAFVDPKGNYLIPPNSGNDVSLQMELNWNILQEYRQKFPQGLDADDFTLTK